MSASMFILHTTIVLLIVLAIRIKLWKKSISSAVVLLCSGVLLTMSNTMCHETFMFWQPLVISAMLFFLVTRAILKGDNDKMLGSLVW